jgi:hypothetical protein
MLGTGAAAISAPCRHRKARIALGRRIRRPIAAPTSAAAATVAACHARTCPAASRAQIVDHAERREIV